MLTHNQIKAIKSLNHKKYRRESGQFLIEGIKLLEEALSVPDLIQHILVSEQYEDFSSQFSKKQIQNIPVTIIPQRVMDSLSRLKTPAPVLAVASLSVLNRHSNFPFDILSGHFMLLDRIQDPGNLGTLFRLAEWFGFSGMLLTPGCAEPDNEKVIRASMGSVFRIPFYRLSDPEAFMASAGEHGFTPYATALKGMPITKINNVPAKWILMMGHEGQGLHKTLHALAEQTISIPGNSRAESLNVAAAASIIAYHLTQIAEISNGKRN